MKKFLLVSMLLFGTLVLFSQERIKLGSDEAKEQIVKLETERSYHKEEVKRHNKEIAKINKEIKIRKKIVKFSKKVS